MNYEYMISKSKNDSFDYHAKIYDYYLNYNCKKMYISKEKNIYVGIFGLFYDALNKFTDRDQILTEMALITNENDLYEYCKRLTGRYIVITKIKENIFIIPDAINSLQINYSVKGKKIIANRASLVAKMTKEMEFKTQVKIKKMATESQAYPRNLTSYKNIKNSKLITF